MRSSSFTVTETIFCYWRVPSQLQSQCYEYSYIT